MNKTLRMGGVFLFALFVMSSAGNAFAGELFDKARIEGLNQQIRAAGAKWVAKETWVSKLGRQELKRMFGSNEEPQGTLDFESTLKGAPGSIDWRNKDGINWLGSVMNQGNCGSCVAFASVATLEGQLSISAGLPWLRPSFSPQQLFACGGGGCDSGWFPSSAANFIKTRGVVDAACAPYTSGSTGDDVACSQATCADASARTYRVSGVTVPSGGFSGNVAAVKAALLKGPLMTTMTVYSDFLTYSGGIYRSVGGERLGGHAVSLVGYDDATRTWLVRNSWGPDWGEGGYVRFSWDDRSGIAASTWGFDVPSQQGYVTVSAPMDREFVSGQYAVKLQGSVTGDAQVQVRAAGQSRAILTLGCAMRAGSDCLTTMDTSTLPDGRYEIVASTSSGKEFSQIREFYVANREPAQMALSFSGAGVDLNQPLKGRIEMNVRALSSPLPFHTVTFQARQNGRVISQRVTDMVVENMKLGFRTNAVPNGEYELLFVGELTAGGKVYSAQSPVQKVTIRN